MGRQAERRLVAPRGQVLDREPLVVKPHHGADVGQRMGQARIVDAAVDEPAGDAELPGRRRRRIVGDAEARGALPADGPQHAEFRRRNAGQGVAQLGGDFQALDPAGQRESRPVRIDRPFDRHVAEVVAAEGPLQLAVLQAGGARAAGSGVSVRLMSRSVSVLEGFFSGSKISTVAVLDRHLRRPLAQLRQRQELRRAPAPVGPAGHAQRGAADRHLRHFQIAGEQVLQVGAATQEALVVGEQLGAGPSAPGSTIDRPRISIPSPLTSVAERIVTFRPGYCWASRASTCARIRLVQVVIEIGHRQRSRDHDEGQAPFEARTNTI